MHFISLNPENQPPRSELHCVRPGRFCLLQLDSGVPLWARCTSVDRKTKTFRGVVEVDALPVRAGAQVVFKKSNIFAIE